MLRIFANGKSTNCAGFTRRDFLQIGSLGAAGLSLPHVLRSRAQAAAEGGSKKP